jgi:hypothetical protein
MSVIDYSKYFEEPMNYAKHADFFPKNIFCVISGATGSGKTNIMLNLLLNKGFLDYTDVYIYSSTFHQPAYKLLKSHYTNLENKIKQTCGKDVK